MKRIIGPRASTLLYNALLANRESYGKGRFILPANVCPIVPVTFLKAGIQVEFLDIDFKSQCISEFHLLSRVKSDSGSIAGVLFVHSYGSKQNTSDIFAELKEIKKELFLIDDYCIGIPEIGTNQQNNSADLILYSTGYAKFVEFGYGGFGYLNDRAAYYMIDGVYEEDKHEKLVQQMNRSISENSPFHYQDSGWLIHQRDLDETSYMEHIENQIPVSTAQKQKLNTIYTSNLPEVIQMGPEFGNWRFNIQVDNKKTILQKIFDAGLFASSHYASISKLFGGTIAPNAEYTHSRMVNLFNDHRFSEDMAYRTCEIINVNIV